MATAGDEPQLTAFYGWPVAARSSDIRVAERGPYTGTVEVWPGHIGVIAARWSAAFDERGWFPRSCGDRALVFEQRDGVVLLIRPALTTWLPLRNVGLVLRQGSVTAAVAVSPADITRLQEAIEAAGFEWQEERTFLARGTTRTNGVAPRPRPIDPNEH